MESGVRGGELGADEGRADGVSGEGSNAVVLHDVIELRLDVQEVDDALAGPGALADLGGGN